MLTQSVCSSKFYTYILFLLPKNFFKHFLQGCFAVKDFLSSLFLLKYLYVFHFQKRLYNFRFEVIFF